MLDPTSAFRPDASFAPGLLDGQVAVVTGGATGIGWEIAQAMARLGARLVLASRNAERLAKAVAELQSSTGAEAIGVPTNVREPAEVEAMVARTVERFGALD